MSGKRFNWNEYDQGRSTSQGSVGSAGSHVHWDEGEGDHLLVPDRDGSGGGLRRRRYAIKLTTVLIIPPS